MAQTATTNAYKKEEEEDHSYEDTNCSFLRKSGGRFEDGCDPQATDLLLRSLVHRQSVWIQNRSQAFMQVISAFDDLE